MKIPEGLGGASLSGPDTWKIATTEVTINLVGRMARKSNSDGGVRIRCVETTTCVGCLRDKTGQDFEPRESCEQVDAHMSIKQNTVHHSRPLVGPLDSWNSSSTVDFNQNGRRNGLDSEPRQQWQAQHQQHSG